MKMTTERRNKCELCGSPLLYLAGLAFVLAVAGLVAGSFVEAKSSDKNFGDALWDNIKWLIGHEDAIDKMEKRQKAMDKQLRVKEGGELRFREAQAAAEEGDCPLSQ